MNPNPIRTPMAIAMHEWTMRFRSSSRCSRNDIVAPGALSSGEGGTCRAPDWGPGKVTRANLGALIDLARWHRFFYMRRRRRGGRWLRGRGRGSDLRCVEGGSLLLEA